MEVLHPRCAGLTFTRIRLSPVSPWPMTGRHDRSSHLRDDHGGPAGAVGVVGRAGCTHVAMEATGVYWKPVWHILVMASSR